METSDYEIIKRCLKGNQEAFSELVARYKKLIYSVVYNMIQDKEEVNDISQEVFIKIYLSLDRYNPEYKFSTWAVKIATNYCLDVLRKKKVDSTPIEEIESVSTDADTPEDRYIKKERRKQIQKAVMDLPEKYRVPIVLFHQNGLSYDEMTKVLDEPMTIIKNRLYRARMMLKEKLLPKGKEEVL
ncbi:MAG: sigma-70 family RNA polymerase sigma factor [Clostridia bacterium]|nr:sigma-70 family RNA polymerase sigma factor [Clostridia bacterium]